MFSAWRVAFVASYLKWPLIVAGGLAVVFAWNERTPGITYWPLATARIAFYAQFFVSLTCLACAAWQARADRRPAVTELARTFPNGRVLQVLISWSTVAAWGLIAYGLAVGISIGIVAPDAHWSNPGWTDPTQGAAVVVGAAAIGYGLGMTLPAYLLIPVWVLGWWAADGVLSFQESSIAWMAPRSVFELVDRSIFRESVPPDVELLQAAWFLTLAAFVMSVCVLAIDRRGRLVGSVIGTALLLVVTSALLFSVSGNVTYGSGRPRLFDPVCQTNEVVEVCLHPAERPLLGESTALLMGFLEPVAGLPNVSTRFVDSAVVTNNPRETGIYIYSEEDLEENVAIAAVEALFPGAFGSGRYELTREQAVVATWLHARAGLSYERAPYWSATLGTAEVGVPFERVQEDIVIRAERFGERSPHEQRRWFERHLGALQSGTLAASDLL